MNFENSPVLNGIILAGGRGTRLWPMTLAVSKQLLPVAGRPMIYFPLSTLMLAGIRQISIICSPESMSQIKQLFGDGSQLGLDIRYTVQTEPLGIAHGFGLASDQNMHTSTLAILGDNFFFGPKLGASLKQLASSAEITKLFAKKSQTPSLFGVLDFDNGGRLRALVEKPNSPPSEFVATGLYQFKPGDLEKAHHVKESARGEREVTDLLNLILAEENIEVVEMPRSTYWSDLGTADEIHYAGNFVSAIESSQGNGVLIPEIISWSNGWISDRELITQVDSYPKTSYRDLIELEMGRLS